MAESSIIIQRSLAADDSCQQMLYAKGHFDESEFREACAAWLESYHGVEVDASGPVRQSYWRTIPASRDECMIGDYVFKETSKGRGAYAVTILDVWLPLFR